MVNQATEQCNHNIFCSSFADFLCDLFLQETLGQLEMGRENVAKLEEICKSLSFFGRQVVPDWQLK